MSKALEYTRKAPFVGLFFEITGNESTESFKSRIGILTVGSNCENRAMACSKHHKTHDRLAIGLFIIFFYLNIAGERAGSFDKLRGGAGVDSQFIGNGEFASRHCIC
jgi:hypothetical protein